MTQKSLQAPHREQTVRVDAWQTNERAIRGKAAIRNNDMDMAMPMHELAKRLDTGHHAGKDIITLQFAAVDFGNRQPGGAGQIAQQRAVKTKVDTESLGDRKEDLSVRHVRADRIGNRVG